MREHVLPSAGSVDPSAIRDGITQKGKLRVEECVGVVGEVFGKVGRWVEGLWAGREEDFEGDGARGGGKVGS